MKRLSTITAGAAIALLVAGTSAVNAETTTTGPNTNRDNKNHANTSATTGKTVRVSEVIGMNIYNPQGEDVGEVNDIVLDPNTGKLRYAAVTYGGFLGIGDKMFAVPWEAFQCARDTDDPDDYRLTLDVSKRQLEGAQGFNQDNWPNFADPNFTRDLDRRYRVNRDQNGNVKRDGRVGFDVNRRGVDVDVNR